MGSDRLPDQGTQPRRLHEPLLPSQPEVVWRMGCSIRHTDDEVQVFPYKESSIQGTPHRTTTAVVGGPAGRNIVRLEASTRKAYPCVY